MKKYLVNYGGIMLFYLSIILCIIIINTRFNLVSNYNMSSGSYSYKD